MVGRAVGFLPHFSAGSSSNSSGKLLSLVHGTLLQYHSLSENQLRLILRCLTAAESFRTHNIPGALLPPEAFRIIHFCLNKKLPTPQDLCRLTLDPKHLIDFKREHHDPKNGIKPGLKEELMQRLEKNVKTSAGYKTTYLEDMSMTPVQLKQRRAELAKLPIRALESRYAAAFEALKSVLSECADEYAASA